MSCSTGVILCLWIFFDHGVPDCSRRISLHSRLRCDPCVIGGTCVTSLLEYYVRKGRLQQIFQVKQPSAAPKTHLCTSAHEAFFFSQTKRDSPKVNTCEPEVFSESVSNVVPNNFKRTSTNNHNWHGHAMCWDNNTQQQKPCRHRSESQQRKTLHYEYQRTTHKTRQLTMDAEQKSSAATNDRVTTHPRDLSSTLVSPEQPMLVECPKTNDTKKWHAGVQQPQNFTKHF